MWRAMLSCFFFSSRRRHTRWPRDWSSDVCSSDLATQLDAVGVPQSDLVLGESQARDGQDLLGKHFPGGSGSPANVVVEQDKLQDVARSEEHTSELQSRGHLVCRLLLEKKK